MLNNTQILGTRLQLNRAVVLASIFGVPILAMQPVQAIDLTEYTQPVSQYERAYITGQMNANSGNQDQTSFDIQGNGNYQNIYSSLEKTNRFEVDGNLSSSRGDAEGSATTTGYDIFGTAQTSQYLSTKPNHYWYGAADLGFRRLQGSGQNDDPFVKIGAGVGMGRIVNATPLALVIRVVEEFLEYGVLKQDLNQAIYLELAQIVSREEEYINRHGLEDYNQFWFKDMEAVLLREGLLAADSLDAVAVLKMNQVLVDERISTRAHGWFLQGGLGYVVSDYAGEDGDPTLDILYRYAKPYGIKTQFIQELNYSTVLSDDTDHLFNSISSLTYEVSDRVDWENGIDLQLNVFGDDSVENIFVAEAFSTYRYYISNRLSTDFTLALSHVSDKVDDNGNDDIEKAVFFGITYRLK